MSSNLSDSWVQSIKPVISNNINSKYKSNDIKRQLLFKIKSITGIDYDDNKKPSNNITKSHFNILLNNHGITLNNEQLDVLFNDYLNNDQNLDFHEFYTKLFDQSNEDNKNWHLFSEEKQFYHPNTGNELVSLPTPPPIANSASVRKVKLRLLNANSPVIKEEKINGILSTLMDVKLIEFVQAKILSTFINHSRLLRFIEINNMREITTDNIRIIWSELNLHLTKDQNDFLNKFIFGFDSNRINVDSFITTMIPSDYSNDYFVPQPSGRQNPSEYSLRKLNAKLKVREEANSITPRVSSMTVADYENILNIKFSQSSKTNDNSYRIISSQFKSAISKYPNDIRSSTTLDLNYQQFLAFLNEQNIFPTDAESHQMFKNFDLNGDGYISIYEFTQKMKIQSTRYILEKTSITSKDARILPTEPNLDLPIGAIINGLFYKVAGKSKYPQKSRIELLQELRLLDTYGNGVIDSRDLQLVFSQKYNFILPKDQVLKLEDRYNSEGESGHLNYKNLVEDIFSGKLVEIPKLKLQNIEGFNSNIISGRLKSVYDRPSPLSPLNSSSLSSSNQEEFSQPNSRSSSRIVQSSLIPNLNLESTYDTSKVRTKTIKPANYLPLYSARGSSLKSRVPYDDELYASSRNRHQNTHRKNDFLTNFTPSMTEDKNNENEKFEYTRIMPSHEISSKSSNNAVVEPLVYTARNTYRY